MFKYYLTLIILISIGIPYKLYSLPKIRTNRLYSKFSILDNSYLFMLQLLSIISRFL